MSSDAMLSTLQPPLSESRLHVIDQAFDKMDVDKSGAVTLDDIRGTYSAEWHPKYKSGERAAGQVFHQWLTNFGGADDGTVRLYKTICSENGACATSALSRRILYIRPHYYYYSYIIVFKTHHPRRRRRRRHHHHHHVVPPYLGRSAILDKTYHSCLY